MEKKYRQNGTAAAADMMGMTRCLVCNLPPKQRQRADAKLVQGVSLSTVAKGLGLSKASVARHARNHLLKKHQAENQLQIADIVPASSVSEAPLDSLVELERLYRGARHQLMQAEQQGNMVVARALRSDCRQLLEFRAKLKGELQSKKQAKAAGPSVFVARPGQFPASKTRTPDILPAEPIRDMPGVVIDLKR